MFKTFYQKLQGGDVSINVGQIVTVAPRNADQTVIFTTSPGEPEVIIDEKFEQVMAKLEGRAGKAKAMPI